MAKKKLTEFQEKMCFLNRHAREAVKACRYDETTLMGIHLSGVASCIDELRENYPEVFVDVTDGDAVPCL